MKKVKENGRIEGEKAKQIEIVKEMLKEGMDIGLIAKITKLTEKEIENIRR